MNLLTEKHLLYPEHLPAAEVVARIRRVLDQSDEPLLKDPRCMWENAIHRASWLQKVNPIHTLIALQREQSLVADNDTAAKDRAWQFACGVVGQHTPGSTNNLWNGLPTQIILCPRVAAWTAGIGSNESFGNSRLWASAARWTDQDTAKGYKSIDLLNDDGSFNRKHLCMDRMEYAEMAYTPSAKMGSGGQLHIREMNASVFAKYIEKAWGEL